MHIILLCILNMCPSSSIHWFHYQQVLTTWIQVIWPYLNIKLLDMVFISWKTDNGILPRSH